MAATADLDGILAAFQKSKEDFAQMQELYQQQKKKSEALQQSVYLLTTERDQIRLDKELQQQEHAELYKKWRSEVREQEDELQRLADKHVPLEHIDRLKSDWAREYDNINREKIQTLQSEKDSLRDTLASERKDHELFAAQAQQREIFAARAAQEERDRHAALAEEAHSRIMQLQELADDSSLNEDLRHALTRNGELEVRLKSVREELEEARQAREALLVEREELELRYIKGAKELQTQVTLAEQNVQAHIRRWQDAAEEANTAQSKIVALHDRLVANEREKAELYQKLEQRAREMQAAEERDLAVLHDARRLHEEEKAAAASTIASLQSRIADLNTAATQQQEQANNQQTVLLAQVSAAEQGVTKEKEAAEARCAAAERAVHEAQLARDQSLATHADELQQMQREVEAARAAMRQAVDSQQRISERANALDAAALAAKREVELRTRECEEAQTELATVQTRHRELVQQSQALQTELDATRTKLEFAMREAETRAAEDDTAQTAAQVNARRVRETHARELADAKEQIQQLTTFVQKHDQEAKAALATVRTAKEKYKKMAATLGAKVASLQREMLEQRKELTVAVQAQSIEAQNAVRQLREAERQRDEFKLRLALEASTSAPSLVQSTLGNDPLAVSNMFNGSALLAEELKQQQELQALLARVSSA